jgi:hypothetical protein
MAYGYSRSRFQSSLPRSDIPAQVQLQLEIPYWYVNRQTCACQKTRTDREKRYGPGEKEKKKADRFYFATEPPEVIFTELPSTSETPRPIPIHPHVYSNGIICLDLLSSAGWSPVQTVESVCMSIQSMLTANSKNERPPGDDDFVVRNRRRPRDINFVYEDDNV